VLKNQVIIGTVNADKTAFDMAIQDLGTFNLTRSKQPFSRKWLWLLRPSIMLFSRRNSITSCWEMQSGTSIGISSPAIRLIHNRNDQFG
jgi:hypothetical protein